MTWNWSFLNAPTTRVHDLGHHLAIVLAVFWRADIDTVTYTDRFFRAGSSDLRFWVSPRMFFRQGWIWAPWFLWVLVLSHVEVDDCLRELDEVSRKSGVKLGERFPEVSQMFTSFDSAKPNSSHHFWVTDCSLNPQHSLILVVFAQLASN